MSKQEEHTQAALTPHINPLKRALHSSHGNSQINVISTCTSAQEMAQSYTPSDQNLFQRILGLINIGEKLLLTSPWGITSQSTGTHCTYWSSKHEWACPRIKAVTAGKAPWSTLSFIWGKNTFPSRTNWRTNSVLAAIGAEGCWTQRNVIAFSLLWCFQSVEVFCPLILHHRECRLNIN